MRFLNRTEQRQVTETMTALLIPMFPYLNDETRERIEIGLRILRNTDVAIKEKSEED